MASTTREQQSVLYSPLGLGFPTAYAIRKAMREDERARAEMRENEEGELSIPGHVSAESLRVT